MENKSDLFEFVSVKITPNPVSTGNSVIIQVDLKYTNPDYPYDYPYDYMKEVE